MYKTLEGQIRPVLCGCKLDLILPYMPTEHPVYAPFLAEAKSLWGKGNLIDVSICHGFFPADIYEQGVAILAVANGDAALAQKAADDLGAKMFAARGQLTRECLTPDEAVRQALHSESYPVVLADVADNPGAGASGDGVELLRKLLEYKADKVAVSSIFDPETVEIAEKAGVGSEIEIDLGGKMMPQFTGGPLHCRAYVKAISDGKYRIRDKVYQGRIANMGKTALLQIDGIYVIVNSVRVQTLDLEAYRSVGIQPQDMQILVTKSTIHYRASFSNVASVMLEVEAPALAVQQPTSAPLAHSRRPIYPLDDI
jgi:microcystin degradation protein MlrC